MSISIRQLMQFAVDNNASDIHIAVNRAPTFRIAGSLKSLKSDELMPADTISMFKEIAPEKSVREIQEDGSADFSYAYEDKCRFRCAAYKSRGVISIVMRQIPKTLMTFDEIGLPESVKPQLDRTRGLFLVCGPTGSGKTTTLATCIDYINTSHDYHIVTIEDPIEFYHEHKKSVVSQREVGVDVSSFSEGLVRSMRQDPDVIMVGEMRDRATIAAAVTAAETGHLVFGTLHTTGATRTVDRIIDAFPSDQHNQIRSQLAGNVVAVISQLLIPRVGGGRVAAFEILYGTSAVENLIRESKTFQLRTVIETNKGRGMRLLDDQLFDLWTSRQITQRDMLLRAVDKKAMFNRIQELKRSGRRIWDDNVDYSDPTVNPAVIAAEYGEGN